MQAVGLVARWLERADPPPSEAAMSYAVVMVRWPGTCGWAGASGRG